MRVKKSYLFQGVLFFLIGIACLTLGILTETSMDGLLFGFAGGGIGAGISAMFRFFYWNAPKNRERYAEKLEEETIEMHDELKSSLRDRAGRYTYLLGLMVLSAAMVAFSILGRAGVIAQTHGIVLVLGSYLIFQIIAGIVIFNRLLNKY